MDSPKKQKEEIGGIGSAIMWPEFRPAWILLGVAIAAGVVDFFGFGGAPATSGPLLLVAIGLLVIVFITAAFSVYRAASMSRASRVDEGELQSILGALNDALIIYDSGFRVIYFNPAAESLFRLNASDVNGHKLIPQDVEKAGWRTLIQVIFPSLAPRAIIRSSEGASPQVADLSFTNPELYLRVTTAPVVDESGAQLGFIKIVRDRTPQVTAIRSRGEFVTIASHQLRGPLTDINWALESLASAQELSETDKMIVQNAAAASRGAIERIESLINISKMDEGKLGYQFTDTDAVEFVGKVLADVMPAARRAGVKIYFDRPPEGSLPKVTIDAQRLTLALVNLLENAIRYNVANGEVTVKVTEMQGKPFLDVSVQDTGIGIPPEAMSKLFTKFYRAENAMKSQTEGSGLGLYVTKGIVEAHGGEVWIDSELNRGTTVHFTLPTDPALVPKHETGLDDAA